VSGQVVGQVTQLQGLAVAVGDDGVRLLLPGSPVHAGESLHVGNGSLLQVTLSGGQAVSVTPGSPLSLPLEGQVVPDEFQTPA
jgi:hypothetical protein